MRHTANRPLAKLWAKINIAAHELLAPESASAISARHRRAMSSF